MGKLLARAYRVHCADVLRNCPKDKLLVLDSVNCGWDVICDFVGKPVPNVPFPHRNKNASITEEVVGKGSRINQIYANHMKRWFRKVLVVTSVSAGAIYFRHEIKEIAVKTVRTALE